MTNILSMMSDIRLALAGGVLKKIAKMMNQRAPHRYNEVKDSRTAKEPRNNKT